MEHRTYVHFLKELSLDEIKYQLKLPKFFKKIIFEFYKDSLDYPDPVTLEIDEKIFTIQFWYKGASVKVHGTSDDFIIQVIFEDDYADGSLRTYKETLENPTSIEDVSSFIENRLSFL